MNHETTCKLQRTLYEHNVQVFEALELLADDMDCIYMNEHIVNLLLEVRGNIRTDKQNMLETINTYLQLPKQEQELFNLGRRLNIMFFLADLNNRAKRKQTEEGLRKIKAQNPDLDLAFVCNYVRQTQI